jgi:hypothetical protein
MDEISELVERAIRIATHVSLREPERAFIAREYLLRLMEELRKGAPNHPALAQLETYVDQTEA